MTSRPTSTIFGTATLPSEMRFKIMSPVRWPSARKSTWMVVSGGLISRPISKSPKPMMERSPGTALPRRWHSITMPTADRSDTAKTASIFGSRSSRVDVIATPWSKLTGALPWRRIGSVDNAAEAQLILEAAHALLAALINHVSLIRTGDGADALESLLDQVAGCGAAGLVVGESDYMLDRMMWKIRDFDHRNVRGQQHP